MVKCMFCPVLVPRDPCVSNPCMNGGMCVSYEGAQYTCRCQQGWTGPNCNQGELLLDDSTLNMHGPFNGDFWTKYILYSLCIIVGFAITFFFTVCPDVDECEKDPCPLGSRCVNTRGSFSCECPLGFDLEDGRTCTRGETPYINLYI